MSEAKATKFNLPKTTTFIMLPLAFTGKDKRFSGLTNAYQFLLALIYTMNKAVRAPAKLTYDAFVEKFGMSRETVSKGLKELIRRKIIERVGNSRYRFLLKFNEDDYIVIDDYLHKKLWDVGGRLKRLPRSRIKTLAFLQRMNDNPKTYGAFVSSQARIGKAIALPKTTAGESVRELVLAQLVHVQSVGGLHCLTRYTVDAELMRVRRRAPEPTAAELEAVKLLFKNGEEQTRRSKPAPLSELFPVDKIGDELRAEALQRELMRDDIYAGIIGQLDELKAKHITAMLSHNEPLAATIERELEAVGEKLKAYLKAHDVQRAFPDGFFYIF